MIYIYDARYNIKTPTTYEKLEGITGSKKATLATFKSKKQKLPRLDYCYLIDDKTSKQQLWTWYSNVEFENETWKDIDNTYKISNYGRFKKMTYVKYPEGKFVIPHVKIDHGTKVPCVWLHKKEYRIKSLVAKYFVNNPNGHRYVINKNGISYDTYHGNLEYCSQSQIASIAAKARFYDNKNILAYDTDGNIIDIYDNATRAGKALFISRQTVLNNLHGETKLACGMYVFKYEDEVI